MRLLLCCLLAAVVCAEDDAGPVAFATWTGDPCTTLTLRVLAKAAPAELVLRGGDGAERRLPTATRPVGGTGWTVAEATASGLTPASTWSVAAADGTALGRYRTAPATLPLRIAVGGDLLHRPEWMTGTTQAMAAANPAFAVVGGDWAYDNADEKAFARWVALWRIWSRALTPDGFAVPVLAGIGNHELPRNGGDLLATPFHAFFPEPLHRAVDVGDGLSLLFLDTDHSERIDAQAPWLEQALRERAARPWRIPVYHVPAYPSVREPGNPSSARVRQHWVPLFERQGVAVAFENHDHALKRTHPLLGGQPATGGVVYLGDGCWGVEPRPPGTPAQRPYLVTSAALHHVWILDLARDRATARAIAPDGKDLDRVELSPRAPAP